jgi:hypothetical protein
MKAPVGGDGVPRSSSCIAFINTKYFWNLTDVLSGDFWQLLVSPVKNELYGDFGHNCATLNWFDTMFAHRINLNIIHRQYTNKRNTWTWTWENFKNILCSLVPFFIWTLLGSILCYLSLIHHLWQSIQGLEFPVLFCCTSYRSWLNDKVRYCHACYLQDLPICVRYKLADFRTLSIWMNTKHLLIIWY